MGRKLGVGIQDFKKLRETGCVYVDKTEYMYRLVQLQTLFFLSRPRRFGKSLFLSMLRYFWEGERELFGGLAIEELLKDTPGAWEPYPVFYFDLNGVDYWTDSALELKLDGLLSDWEKQYGIDEKEVMLSQRFERLLETAYTQTGKRCVVLVDEYDKPLLDVMTDAERAEHNRQVFKGFFSVLKSYDRCIQFAFITGVTKFSKISIFSDLNNLTDISMDSEYSGICGITEEELRSCFLLEVKELSGKMELEEKGAFALLKRTYDGYHFSGDGMGVYNPYSLLTALMKKKIDHYWFETGTPTFLIKMLKKINFDPARITDRRLYATVQQLKDYRIENMDPVPLLYQAGYLTIQEYDEEMKAYQLGYPNEEVKYGFIASLAPEYTGDSGGGSELDISQFIMDMRCGDTDSLRDRFREIYARLPYGSGDYLERDFQNVIYIVFMLMGERVFTELHSSRGRADVVVELKDYIYIFEFKRDKSAAEALSQIEELCYGERYVADPRHIIKIGANFDSEKRSLSEWECRR